MKRVRDPRMLAAMTAAFIGACAARRATPPIAAADDGDDEAAVAASEAQASALVPVRLAARSQVGRTRGGLEHLRSAVVAAARRHLGKRVHGDCSGFVLRVYREAGLAVAPQGPARSLSEALWKASRPVTRPHPGDLAFFHDTYDRNRDDRIGDPWSHSGVVESVSGDAVLVIHRSGTRIERLRMNLSRPGDEQENDRLRMKRPSDRPGTRYLAGELFAAFGALLGSEFTRMSQSGHAAADTVRHTATR